MWGRANSGKIPVEPSELNFSEICREVSEIMRADADKKKLRIECAASTDIAVTADRNILKTVLRNLLSNAVKFSYPGGRITVSAEENASQVIISVADTGVGLSGDVMKHLFDSAEIQTRAGTANEQGTGLGLLICKELVEKLDGTIWAENNKESGSLFKFTLKKGE